MTHKGNKSDETIVLEKLFIGIMRAYGMEVFYEYQCGTGTIDFVVGFHSHKPGYMYHEGMTGVELKSSMSDFRTGNGLNIKTFPFTYMLVPERIAYSAIKHMEKNVEFNHVGLLVLMDDYYMEIHKHAEFLSELERNSIMIPRIKESHFTEYIDAVAYGMSDDCVSCHNYETNETWTERVTIEVKREKLQ